MFFLTEIPHSTDASYPCDNKCDVSVTPHRLVYFKRDREQKTSALRVRTGIDYVDYMAAYRSTCRYVLFNKSVLVSNLERNKMAQRVGTCVCFASVLNSLHARETTRNNLHACTSHIRMHPINTRSKKSTAIMHMNCMPQNP